MIYADGAGATILEETADEGGILSHSTLTYTAENEADFIFYGNCKRTRQRLSLIWRCCIDTKCFFIKKFGQKFSQHIRM